MKTGRAGALNPRVRCPGGCGKEVVLFRASWRISIHDDRRTGLLCTAAGKVPL